MSVVHFIVNQTPQPPYTGPYWSGVEQHPDFGGNMADPEIAIKDSGSTTRTILAGTPISKTTKSYWEIYIGTTGVSGAECYFGVRPEDNAGGFYADYSGAVGDSDAGWGCRSDVGLWLAGADYIGGIDPGLKIWPSWDTVNTFYTLQVAVDPTGGSYKVWQGLNGTWYFYDGASTDPVAGTDQIWDIGFQTYDFYPALSVKENSATTAELRITSSDVLYLPSGYTALGDI